VTTREDLVDGGHRWLRHTRPFPHVVAHDAFRPEVYASLDGQFREWLARGLRDEPSGTDTVFSRAMGSYDAYGYNFSQPLAGAFDVLLSRAWCGLLADLFRVKDTHHVNLGLHHHLPHSASGWAHTDLAPGWFADDQPGPDEMTLSDHARVDYHTGDVLVPDVRAVEEVRAVAVLLYLANDEWHPGDGGETALFTGSEGRPDQVAARVPPLNNTMLAFECTPYSFHTFLSNTRTPRNCLVMWLHRPKEEAVQRWGEQSIVYWRR
jgi:hypothetical protein